MSIGMIIILWIPAWVSIGFLFRFGEILCEIGVGDRR